MRGEQRFQKSDLLWLLAFPLYEVIGTIRHEASHALIALAEGAKIEQFVVWPSTIGGQHFWGYVFWSGSTDWVPVAAPYLCDLLTYLLFFFLCTRLSFKRHWVWINLIILGLISPLVNSGYQYLLAFFRPGNDITQLLYELPAFSVHTYFGTTILLYVLGLLVILVLPNLLLGSPSPMLQTPPLRRRRRIGLWVVLGAVALLVNVAFIGEWRSGTSTATNSIEITAPVSQVFRPEPPATPTPGNSIGQPVAVGSWTVTLNAVTTSKGTDSERPKAGDIFLIMNVTLHNTLGHAQYTSSTLQWALRDVRGQWYYQDIAFGNRPDGIVAAGGIIRGTLAYEVPQSVQGFILQFVPGTVLMVDDPAKWTISISDGQRAIPELLKGSR